MKMKGQSERERQTLTQTQRDTERDIEEKESKERETCEKSTKINKIKEGRGRENGTTPQSLISGEAQRCGVLPGEAAAGGWGLKRHERLPKVLSQLGVDVCGGRKGGREGMK